MPTDYNPLWTNLKLITDRALGGTADDPINFMSYSVDYILDSCKSVYNVTARGSSDIFAKVGIVHGRITAIPVSENEPLIVVGTEDFNLSTSDVMDLDANLKALHNRLFKSSPTESSWELECIRELTAETRQKLQYRIEELNNKPKLKLTVEFISGKSKEDIMTALISGDDGVISDVVVESDLGKELSMTGKNMLRTGTSEMLVRTMKSFEVRKVDPKVEGLNVCNVGEFSYNISTLLTTTLATHEINVGEFLSSFNNYYGTSYLTIKEIPWDVLEYVGFLNNFFNLPHGSWESIGAEPIDSRRPKFGTSAYDRNVGHFIKKELISRDLSANDLLSVINRTFSENHKSIFFVPWASSPRYAEELDTFFDYNPGCWINYIKEGYVKNQVDLPITPTPHCERIGYLVAEELRTSGKSEEALLIKIAKGNKVKYNHVTHVPWTSSKRYIDILVDFFGSEISVWEQRFKSME